MWKKCRQKEESNVYKNQKSTRALQADFSAQAAEFSVELDGLSRVDCMRHYLPSIVHRKPSIIKTRIGSVPQIDYGCKPT